MAVWEVIDATDEEETKQVVNDGSLTSLYEVIKLAYLEPSQETNLITLPKIQSNVSFGLASISIDSSIFIFGEGCSSFHLNLTLEDTIDIMVWLHGGKFLLLADNSGKLHCLHLETKQVLFTKKLPLSKGNKETLFIEGQSFISYDGTSSIVFITSSGKIIRLDGIEIESMEEGLQTRDDPFLKSLQSKISFSIFSTIEDDVKVSCGDCLMLGSNLRVWLSTSHGIYLWISQGLYTKQPVIHQLAIVPICLQLTQLMNGRYLVILDHSRCLKVLCAYTGIVVWDAASSGARVGSVINVQCLSSDASSVQLLLLLQRLEDEKEDTSFCILHIPSLELSHMVSVGKAALPCVLGLEADSIVYLEPEFGYDDGAEEGDEKGRRGGCLSRIKLKSVVDGVPEARLAKLLRNLKFNEAEQFCGNFGLDVNEVLKAKANYLCDLMNPWRSSLSSNSMIQDHGTNSGFFDELLLTLGRVDDNEFVTLLCINAALSDVALTRQLLSYAKERLANSSQSGESDHLSALMQKVSKNLYCLCTFQSIFPFSDIHHWLSFSRASMLQELLCHLKQGDLEVAATIWHRHQFEFLQQVDMDCVKKILEAIPFNVPSSTLCSWLPKHLLRDLIKLCPSAIEVIAGWSDKRVKNLEIVEKDRWPSNGLRLATTTIHTIETIASDFYTDGDVELQLAVHMAQWKAHSPSSALGQLRHTSLALTDLELLASKYMVKIEFCKYTQEDKEEVIYALLDWLMSGEEVEPLVSGFVRSFALLHNLHLDRVLERYVTECLASFDCNWWLYEEAPWEDKTYAVIAVISDSKVKAKCIVECVRMAPAPWSKGTREICALGMGLNTPFTRDLEDQERLSRLKIVLRRHNLHLVKYEEGRNGEFLLRSIASRDGETIMKDALTVVSAVASVQVVDAYYYRVLHLLKTDQDSDVKSLLSALTEEQRNRLCNTLVYYTTQQLNIRPLNQKCRQNLRSFTSGIVAIRAALEPNMNLRFSLHENIFARVRRINILQKKFDLYPSLDDLDSEESCLALLKTFVIDLYLQYKTACSNPPPNSNVTRIGITTLKKSCHGAPSTGGGTTFLAQGSKEHRSLNYTHQNSTLVEEEKEGVECVLEKHMDKVKYLSFLLGIASSRLLSFLASLANEQGQLEAALQFTRQLASDSETASARQYIFQLVELTLKCEDESKVPPSQRGDETRQKGDLMGLVSTIVSSAMLTCHPRDFVVLNEIWFWYHIGKYLYEQCHLKGICANDSQPSTSFWYWKFSPMFIDSSMPIEEPVVSCNLFKIISNVLQIHKNKSLDTSSTDLMSDACLWSTEAVNSVMDLCCHLQERNQDLFAFIILQAVSSRSFSQPKSKVESSVVYLKGLTTERVMTLLMKMVNSKQQDFSFACSLLTHLTVKESLVVLMDIAKRLAYDFSRLLIVGEIGTRFCRLKNLTKITDQFSMLIKKANWGKLLGTFGISFKAAFSGDRRALQKTLQELMFHPQCNFAILESFCEDFNWDVTQALSGFLKGTIRIWKQQEKEGSKVDNSFQEVPSPYVKKIMKIISKIEDKEEARLTLEELFMTTSSYNYEVLDVIMSALSFFKMDDGSIDIERGKNILHFLKSYHRWSDPTNAEKDSWLSTNPEFVSLPSISQFRLPFHDLYNKDKSVMTKLFEKELNLNTIDKWISIAGHLQQNPDQLYFLTTQNIVTTSFKDQNTSWQVCSSNRDLLVQVQSIISRIEHRNLSTACANWIVGHIAPGEDKVWAAKKCFQLANHCLKNNQEATSEEKVRTMCQKFQQRYHRLAIEHELHKYGLDQPEYLSLIQDPETLVFRLYEHPSVSSLITLSARQTIDVNSCVKKICSIMNFNQTAIQMELLTKWLPMTSCLPDDQDQTVSNFVLELDQHAQGEAADSISDDSLSRVIFLLRCCPQDQAVCYLLSQVFSQSETLSTGMRLKALQCLLTIANQETIQCHQNITMKEIGLLLQTLTYVSRLERLGHAIHPSSFPSMDKNALVEGIWRTQRHNPEALLLLVDICRDFKIPTASLWEELLRQLTSFTKSGKVEVKVLEKVVMGIRTIPHLWLLPQMIVAWTQVIYSPFRKAYNPVSKESLEECVHAINLLLQSCPVDVPLESLLDLCASLDLPVLALALQYKMQANHCQIEDLVRSHSSSKLISQYELVREDIALPPNIEELLSTLK